MVKRKAAQAGVQAPTPTRPSFPAGTLGEWLDYVMPGVSDDEWSAWLPVWPPDAFAIGAGLLRRTGGYIDLVNGDKQRKSIHLLDRKDVRNAGTQWREDLDQVFDVDEEKRMKRKRKRIRDVCPPAIQKAWKDLKDAALVELSDLRRHKKATAAAVTLCTISDCACEGIGIGMSRDGSENVNGEKVSPFLRAAEAFSKDVNNFRSYCLHIPPAKLAVLGKRHTPQRGCSIRSLTHHLALYTPTEIQAVWPAPIAKTNENIDVFNVLLLPWPTEVVDRDFALVPKPGDQRYFDYRPKLLSGPTALERVKKAMKSASKYVERVHAVVLPELALDQSEFQKIELHVAGKRALLVSGVRRKKSAETCDMPSNTCTIQPYGLTQQRDKRPPRVADLDAHRWTQTKHHRWCLDRQQIMQYRLGGRLPASRDCWENAYIGSREIHFVTLTSWLTISTLICEDLARQEPVTEVLRAVGPNLIFALLMDGPQLKSRWSSRYALVLAEDPGCSVLSLTSLGMSRRSKPADVTAPDKSNFIALWRDAVYGEQEISLDPGHDACVLSLVNKTREEFTIDGHRESRRAHFPVYAGHTSFQALPMKSGKMRTMKER